MEEIEELKAELAALRQRVCALEDHRDLNQLVAQYGPSVDSGCADETTTIWTRDGEFAVLGGEHTFTMKGSDDNAAMVNGDGHQSLIENGCAHVLTAPHVVIAGDKATGRGYALNIRWDREADRFWVARVSANRWTWARTAEGWKVTERINANLDGAEASRALLAP
jgi:SnoaL-like domain